MGTKYLSEKIIDKSFGEKKASLITGKNTNTEIISKIINDGSALLEAIAVSDGDEYQPKLLISDGLGYLIDEAYHLKGHCYVAISPDYYPYKPYVFDPRISYGLPSTSKVFDKVLAEVKKFTDLEHEYQILISAAILLSYVQERFDTLPYIYLLGDNESGKSHTLRLIAELAYRPLYGVSIPAADLFTYLGSNDYTPTIIEDEIQGIEKDTEKAKVWKAGYKRGAKVPRIINDNRAIRYHNVFCLKLAAGEKLITLKGLAERFIVIQMIEGWPEKDHYDDEDLERFMDIRRDLLLWRCNMLLDPKLTYGFDLDWLRGRMRELYLPLLTVIRDTTYYQVLEDFVREKVEERKEARRNSLEGFLTKIVATLIEEKASYEIPFIDIWVRIKQELDVEEHPSKPDRLETEAYGVLSKQKTGRRLREVLGSRIRRERVEGRPSVIHVFDPKKLERAVRRYRVTDVTDLCRILAIENSSKSLENPREKA